MIRPAAAGLTRAPPPERLGAAKPFSGGATHELRSRQPGGTRMQLFRRRPSAAFIVAVFALCFAVVGSAIAGTEASKKALSKSQVKKISKKQADKEIDKKAPGLSVAHATSADTATSATSASTATNANSPSVYAHVTISGSSPNVDESRSKGLADADFKDVGTRRASTARTYRRTRHTTRRSTSRSPRSMAASTCSWSRTAARAMEPGSARRTRSCWSWTQQGPSRAPTSTSSSGPDRQDSRRMT